MIALRLDELAARVDGALSGAGPEGAVHGVSVDSRHIRPGALFVALPGQRAHGHRFVAPALAAGAGAALVGHDFTGPVDGPLVRVASPLAALQRLAAWYRREHLGQVVAITGSNGKTITKDTLAHILRRAARPAAASPGSYNSQLGVALALLGAPAGAPLGVFEAGISAPGEMSALRDMLAPGLGLLTNVGLSHIANFRDQDHLAREKLSLFAEARGWVLLPPDPRVRSLAAGLPGEVRWSDEVAPWGEGLAATAAGARLTLRFEGGERHEIQVHTRAPELVDDMLLAARAATLLGVDAATIASALDGHAPPPTRLEVWRSPGGVTLVNDALSSDPLSVRAALRATASLASGGRKLFVFGGMGELGERAESEHRAAGATAAEQGFRHLLLLDGEQSDATAQAFLGAQPGGQVTRVESLAQLPAQLGALTRPGDVVLLKGPRARGIDEVAGELFGAMAPSRLLVDLRAVGENIARFRAQAPGTLVLAVVKALAYGSALAEVAQGVGQLPVDWFGVTTADEGAQLRASGVELPVLVTLVTADEASKITRHQLTPALSSPSLVEPLARAARAAGVTLDVHLKIDTGMGRLGVHPTDAVDLALAARDTGVLRVTGAMTHFSGADDPDMDDHTRLQIDRFNEALASLASYGFSGLLTHAAASAASARFPEARYGMMRLGLALHGVAPSPAAVAAVPLELAVSLVSKLAQVREVPRGWTIGYGATYRVERERMRLGVVPLGYHDGIPRSLSNRGWAMVAGQRAPLVGRVSMDSILLDVTDIPEAHEGADVLIFGRQHGVELRPEELAEAAGTIAYELLARVGPRIQRVYIGA